MRLLALLTLSMWSNAAIADEGSFTFLGLNQCAPFEGILFDPTATANVLAEVQTAKEECQIKLTYELGKQATEYELELQKKKELENKQNANKKEIGWGNQIRSYVLHPYRMVKDLRSNFEDPDPEAVLDGNIEKLIKSNLRK